MKAPKFWRVNGIIAQLLLPFSVFYYLFTILRNRGALPRILSAKIVCIGNITAGGAGKTPTAIAIGNFLKIKKKKFAYVSKGYLGKIRIPTKVDIKKHTAVDVGDEALLLAREGDCWVGKSRFDTCNEAIKNGAKILILDDGMQDLSIAKDVTLLVIDGTYGFGNGLVIPAGPLRGRKDVAVEKCDGVILIGEDKHKVSDFVKKYKRPIIKAEFKPKISIDKKQKYIAFAGIGNPEKFFLSLEKIGIKPIHKIEFPDHHYYSRFDISRLQKLAKQNEAKLITTEKDLIRLPEKFKQEILTLPVDLIFANESKIENILEHILVG